jgi:predicted ATP-binding protein involved in virulence
MISHMMLHLFYQQPNINDPADLEGIVIIDEIDLHFHPKMQRDLVIKLTEIFPEFNLLSQLTVNTIIRSSKRLNYSNCQKKSRCLGVYVERMDLNVEFHKLAAKLNFNIAYF